MSDQSRPTPLSELARAALLGAERESVPEPMADSLLAPFWAQLGDVAPEYQLLSMAGVSKLYQQAGTMPARAAARPYPAAAEEHNNAEPADEEDPLDPSSAADSEPKSRDELTSRRCSMAAGEVLVTLMDGTHKTLLPEYLRMMAAANLTIPAEYLPNVLSYGAGQYALRDVVQSVSGHNGQKLAAQNPRWLYASPIQISWEAARRRWKALRTGAARQGFLRQLRSHDPEFALRLLQSVWKSEQPSSRVALMRALEVRLSMDDEPFLETALDDRNNAVRKKASDLLTTMPESRLCQRMARNTESLLEWVSAQSENGENENDKNEGNANEGDANEQNAKKRNASITVHFPDELSPEMQRDGVLKRTIKDDSRRRRMELLDMVTAVPLNVWTERWQVTPDEIVQAVQQSRWPRTLTQALVQAAERQQNHVWVDALLEHAEFKLPAIKLIGLLTPAKFDALIERIDVGVDADNPLNKSHPLVTAVRRWVPPWSESLSKRWLDHLESQMPFDEENVNVDSLVRTATKQFVRCCAPSLIDEAIDRLEALKKSCPKSWGPTVEQSLATVKMRRKMRDVINDC